MKTKPSIPGSIYIEAHVVDIHNVQLYELLQATLSKYMKKKVTITEPIVITVVDEKRQEMSIIFKEIIDE